MIALERQEMMLETAPRVTSRGSSGTGGLGTDRSGRAADGLARACADRPGSAFAAGPAV